MNGLSIALGLVFLLCIFVMIIMGIFAIVFSAQFRKALEVHRSVFLPENQGYAFGMNKVDRQKRYRKYFMSREFINEKDPELRRLGSIGRRLYIALFANLSVAVVVAICFAIINMHGGNNKFELTMSGNMQDQYIFLLLIISAIYFIGMFAQQTLAKKLLHEGINWSRAEVQGRFLGTMEGNYWLLFLFSLRWKKLNITKKVKAQCMIWTVFDVITLLLIFALLGYLFWSQWEG